MKNRLVLIALLILLPALPQAQTLTAYHNTVPGGYNFWVSTPADYDSLKADKPIILFLHGASLCGNDLERVRRYGPLHALAMGKQIDAVIIAPQNPSGAWKPERINRVVDWVYSHYSGDTNRFYVIGMSLGGYGTIDYSAAYSHRIAAAMALCGGGNPKNFCDLNEIPLWILHGTADHVVGIEQSQKVVNSMARCGDTTRLRFTKLTGVSHSGLARAFYLPETYDWLFQHRLDTPDRPVSHEYDITVDLLHKAYRNIDRKSNKLEVVNSASKQGKESQNNDSTTVSTANSTGNAAVTDGEGEAKYYTIREGDTLSAIARKHHTTVRALCRLNGIKESTLLRIGRRLRVR